MPGSCDFFFFFFFFLDLGGVFSDEHSKKVRIFLATFAFSKCQAGLPLLSFGNRIMMLSGTSTPSIPLVKQHLSLPALTVPVKVVTLSLSLIW